LYSFLSRASSVYDGTVDGKDWRIGSLRNGSSMDHKGAQGGGMGA